MSFHPVLPPLLLAVLAVVVVVARLIALRRSTPAMLWRWIVLTGAALLLIGAASRPLLGGSEAAPRVADPHAPNVFLLVDQSADMGLPDAAGGRPRMAAAREDIAAVVEKYPAARFAVIGFSSRAFVQWPLSPDVWSLQPVMSTVMPDDVRLTNAAAAGNTLRYQLINAKQQYPQAQTLVFYFGAGVADSRSPQGQFNLPDDAVDGGAVFGYGTAGPIPEQTLRAVSEQIGVPYVQRGDGESLDASLPVVNSASLPVTAVPATRTELYWIFAIGSATLLLVELYLVLRAFRRTQMLTAKVDP